MNIPVGKRMGLKGTGDGKALVQRKRDREKRCHDGLMEKIGQNRMSLHIRGEPKQEWRGQQGGNRLEQPKQACFKSISTWHKEAMPAKKLDFFL